MRRAWLRSMTPILAVLFLCGPAQAIAPNILPGFPMRAGPMVMLMWTPTPGATEYKVMRRAEGGQFAEVARQPAPPFNDTSADPVTTYEYQVVPVVGGADGEPSKIVKLAGQKKLEPPKITGTRATAEQVLIRWKVAHGAAFYNLYRGEGETGDLTLVGSVQDNKYADVKVEAGKTYRYQLSSVDASSTESPRSKEAKVMVPKVVKKVERVPETYVTWTQVGEIFGEPGYELKSPTDLEVGPDGTLHVVDFLSVQVFDQKGTFVRRYGFDKEKGWKRPGGIAFSRDGQVVYVTYYAESVIRSFNAQTGVPIAEYTYEGYGPFKPNPNDVAEDMDGNLWVADGVLFQLVVLDPRGNELHRFGRERPQYERGKEPPVTDFPSVAIVRFDPADGRIYVGEKTSARVKAIDPAKVAALSPDDHVIEPDLILGGTGNLTENLQGIGNIDFTLADGRLIFLDNLMNVIKVFNAADGKYVETWIGDSDDAQTKKKLDTAFSASFEYDEKTGNLFVSSAMLNKVWIFRLAE